MARPPKPVFLKDGRTFPSQRAFAEACEISAAYLGQLLKTHTADLIAEKYKAELFVMSLAAENQEIATGGLSEESEPESSGRSSKPTLAPELEWQRRRQSRPVLLKAYLDELEAIETRVLAGQPVSYQEALEIADTLEHIRREKRGRVEWLMRLSYKGRVIWEQPGQQFHPSLRPQAARLGHIAEKLRGRVNEIHVPWDMEKGEAVGPLARFINQGIPEGVEFSPFVVNTPAPNPGPRRLRDRDTRLAFLEVGGIALRGRVPSDEKFIELVGAKDWIVEGLSYRLQSNEGEFQVSAVNAAILIRSALCRGILEFKYPDDRHLFEQDQGTWRDFMWDGFWWDMNLIRLGSHLRPDQKWWSLDKYKTVHCPLDKG